MTLRDLYVILFISMLALNKAQFVSWCHVRSLIADISPRSSS
jgi:hypothetical protein